MSLSLSSSLAFFVYLFILKDPPLFLPPPPSCVHKCLEKHWKGSHRCAWHTNPCPVLSWAHLCFLDGGSWGQRSKDKGHGPSSSLGWTHQAPSLSGTQGSLFHPHSRQNRTPPQVSTLTSLKVTWRVRNTVTIEDWGQVLCPPRSASWLAFLTSCLDWVTAIPLFTQSLHCSHLPTALLHTPCTAPWWFLWIF